MGTAEPLGHLSSIDDLLDRIPAPVVATDADGVVLLWNGGAELLYGLSHESAMGRPLVDLIAPPDSGNALREAMCAAARDGRWQGELEVVVAGSGTRPVRCSLTALTDVNEDVHGFLVVSVEASAASGPDVPGSAVTCPGPAPILTVGFPDLVVREWHDAAERIFGYLRHEIVGKPVSMLSASGRADEIRAVGARLKAGERSVDLETAMRRRDGSTVPVALTLSAIDGTSGRVTGLAWLVRDVGNGDVAELPRLVDFAERLQRISSALVRSTTLSDVIDTVLGEVRSALGADAVAIARLSADGARFQLLAAHGYSDQVLDQWRSFPIDAPLLTAEAARRREPIISLSAEELRDPYPESFELRRLGGYESGASFPLIAGDRSLGVLALNFKSRRPFAADDHMFLQTVADQCAQAIERAELFEAAVAEQQRFETLVAASPLAVMALGPDGVVRSWNPAAERIFGWSAEEAIGRLAPFIDAESSDSSVADADSGFAVQDVRDVQRELRRKDGTTAWIRVWNVPIRDPARGIAESFCIVEDITARKTREEAVEGLAAIVDSSGDAILTATLDGLIDTWNPAAEEMFGYSPEEIVGRPLTTLMPAERHSDVAMLMPRVARGETVHGYETVRRRKNGELFDVSLTVSPVRDADGKIVRGSSAMRDISDRKRFERHRASLQRITDTALAHLDTDDLLRELLSRVVDVLGADGAVILLLDRSRRVLTARAAKNLSPDVAAGIEVPLGRGFAGRIAESKRPWIVEDVSRIEVVSPYLRESASSLVGVPLIAEGDVIGVLHAFSARPRAFTGDEAVLLQLAADRAAIAILHAQRYEQEHELAETLQLTLLPASLPELARFDMAARYRPAGRGAVGGDFYDAIPLSPDEVTLVIGDVCGKGVPAAALTSMARHTIRALVARKRKPMRVLSELNRAILRVGSETPFLTAAVARVAATAGGARAVVSLGGHPPALLLRNDGSVECLGRAGMLLGFYDDVLLSDAFATLAVGEALLLYTDGATEARVHGDLFGEERLKAVLAGCAGLAAADVVERVERAVLAHQGSPQDDIALFCLRVLG